MLNYVLKKIKGFFQKNRKQNNIQIDTVKNGNIYQDSIIKVENPAIALVKNIWWNSRKTYSADSSQDKMQ